MRAPKFAMVGARLAPRWQNLISTPGVAQLISYLVNKKRMP